MDEISAHDIFTLLIVSIGGWAAVLAWIARGIFKRMDAIAATLQRESEKLNQYIVQTETRLAVLENKIFS